MTRCRLASLLCLTPARFIHVARPILKAWKARTVRAFSFSEQTMSNKSTPGKGDSYLKTVAALGITLWLAAAINFFASHSGSDQLMVIVLVPLVVITGMFPN